RLGGEEFVLMLPSTTTHEAMEVAERLRRAVELASIETGVGQLRATISLGVASLEDAASTLQELLAAADKALYDAKTAGRNCVRTLGGAPISAVDPATNERSLYRHR
ncbi:GGDEF domain-containing protein, partial [Paraburkholderia strydomiana]